MNSLHRKESLSSAAQGSDNILREKLKRLGFNPGPIVDSTRKFYINKLETLQDSKCSNVNNLCGNFKELKVNEKPKKKTYSFDSNKCLRNADWTHDLKPFKKLEEEARHDFTDPRRRSLNGTSKTSFTYLLLDPRITANLPSKAKKLNVDRLWTTFIDSIFYVGKGKNDRPYRHLNEAVPLWEHFKTSKDKKTQRILDIWEVKRGVVCIQVFHNVSSDEALTYEAAMIDALDINTLTNLKLGSYKGVVASWTKQEQCMLGIYLLYKAMLNYLNEGERELHPDDV